MLFEIKRSCFKYTWINENQTIFEMQERLLKMTQQNFL